MPSAKARKHIAAAVEELDALRELIVRDLGDAGVKELSADRRFATAYNAALQTAKMAIVCAGYRLASMSGHHKLTFEAAHLALGPAATKPLDYLDASRRKRNAIDYDHASMATETEADEMLVEARGFLDLVEKRIADHHPKLAR